MLRYRSISADHAAISQRSQKWLTQDKKRLGSLHLAYISPKIYIKWRVLYTFTGGVDWNDKLTAGGGSTQVAAFTGGVDWNTAVGDYKRNVPVAAFTGGMYAALRLCDLPPLCIFLNQKQGYCILDAATLFSEKTVIGEQRYSADNVYRLSHIAMFVKSFPLKTAGSVLPNRCPENCRQSKYDRLGSRAQLLSRKKSEFDNGFCGSCLKFAYNKIMMLCAQYYKYWRNRSTAAQIKAAAVPANKYNA